MQPGRVWILGAALLALGPRSIAQGFGPGGAMGPMAQLMGPMRLLSMPEVQKEIDLRETQKSQIDQLRIGLFRQAHDLLPQARALSPGERDRRFAPLRRKWDRELRRILNQRQQARLAQLELQQERLHALGRGEVAEALKLTPTQQEEVRRLLDREQQTMRAARPAVDRPGPPLRGGAPEQRATLFGKMAEVRTATKKEIAALLTDEQKTRLTEMEGAPFRFIDHSPDTANDGGPTRREGALKVGDPAPDFTLADLLEGSSTVQISSFHEKKPVVLVFGSYT